MKRIRLVSVGRLKTAHWKDAAAHYAARIRHFAKLEEAEVKDAPADLSVAERMRREGEGILRQIETEHAVVCLDERGDSLTSVAFAEWLRRLEEQGKTPCFVIGGAFGLAPEVKKTASRLLCLGAMTLPHELARVVLLEQIYRAGQILAGTGYHHE